MSPQAFGGVVFVDLDGTITLENTFHTFLLSSWRHGPARLRAVLVSALMRRVIVRSYDRVCMKRDILLAVDECDSRDAITADVITRLMANLSVPIMARLEHYRSQEWLVVLATAAPDMYAEAVADQLALDGCLCTPTYQAEGVWTEVSGVAKRAACEDWLAQNGLALTARAAMTDSVDDLPMLALCHEVTLQGSPRQLARIRASLRPDVPVQEFDTESSQPGGGYWLWYEDGTQGPFEGMAMKSVVRARRSHAMIYVEPGVWVAARRLRSRSRSPIARLSSPRPPSPFQRLVCLLGHASVSPPGRVE